MKVFYNFSPNYSRQVRNLKSIKFVIIHYTGMQSEIESINRLKSHKHKVSCHYLINRRGNIIQMVRDKHIAWHAGKSRWQNYYNLNESSLGIELVNKGHRIYYQNFTKAQIKSLIKLCKFIKKKYRIKKENFLGHSDIAPLRKIDPGEKFPWERLSKHKIGKWYLINKKIFKFKKNEIEKLFFKNLGKIGYKYFNKNLRKKTDKKIINSFQRHFLPKNITGKIDQKTYIISHFLAH